MKSDPEEDKITEADRIIECLKKTKKEREAEDFYKSIKEMLDSFTFKGSVEFKNKDKNEYYVYNHNTLDNTFFIAYRNREGSAAITQTKSRTGTQGHSGEYYLVDIEAGGGTGQLFDDMLSDKTKP